MVLLGLIPLESIDRDMRSESSSMLRRLEPVLDVPDAAERLTQQLCVELEIGQNGAFTLDEFSVAVDKLDFESWDMLVEDFHGV
jgi:hypothetical protein